MSTIYTQIDSNKKQTWLVISLFIAFITFVSWFIGEIYYQDGFALVGIALIFSGVSSYVSYYNSDKIVLSISGAKELLPEENSEVHHLVENICIAAGLPKPKIYTIEDTAMNAFATGRDPEHSAICFTTGIIAGLEKRELEGVIAHELSHIGNFDIRLLSIVSILVGTVTLLADFFTRGMFYKRSSRRDSELNGVILILGILFIIVSPIIATLIKLAVSRNREYLADASAALITRYPKGLADALRKLANDHEILEAANGATAHLYIANPLKNVSGAVSQMFQTHPPIEERIKRLESM